MRARLFDVRRLPSATGSIRVAILVPKYGLTAVRRNRLKRRLRELVRRQLLAVPVSNDLLIRARRSAYDADFATLRDDLEQVAPQLLSAETE